MPNDFQQKQPSKNEKLIYELYMHQEQMDRSLWTTSSFVTALALLLDIDPEKVAKLLTEDHAKIQEYSKKINAAIDEIEKKHHHEHKHDEGHVHTEGDAAGAEPAGTPEEPASEEPKSGQENA